MFSNRSTKSSLFPGCCHVCTSKPGKFKWPSWNAGMVWLGRDFQRLCSSNPPCLSAGGTQFPQASLMQEVQMEPRSHLWVGLDPHSADGLGIVTLDLCPGPFPAAPAVVRRWSLQQSDLAQSSQLTAARGAFFQMLSSTPGASQRPLRMRGLSWFSEMEHPKPGVQEVSGNLSHIHVSSVGSGSVAPVPLVALSTAHRGASHPSQSITKLC